MVITSLIYGKPIPIERITDAIPQLKKKLNLNMTGSTEAIMKQVQESLVTQNLNGWKKQFHVVINQRNEKVAITIELGLYFVADLDGNLQFYFGQELIQSELKDSYKMQEVILPDFQEKEAIRRVFKRFHFGEPQLLLVEAML
jgi:hypothetical protein